MLCDGGNMDFDQFKREVGRKLHVGLILNNPGKGTSQISSLSDKGVSYIRGHSTIYVSFQDLFEVLNHFIGEVVTSSDLMDYKPSIFDPKARKPGHSCNCTFFFMLLERIGIVSKIGGRGVKGDPFFVNIPPNQ
jgi:hypothetical protein